MAEATTNPAVSVVVPVRNEAGNVAPLVAEIAAALDGRWRYEVVYVNDGSSDGTEAELRPIEGAASVAALAAARAVLRSIGRVAQRRRGGARAHCRHARRRRAERPGVSSSTDRSAAVGAPRVGLVAGQRVGRKATGFKKFQSRVANGVRGAILRDGTRDTGCGLKAFQREMFMSLPYFDGLHRFLPALVKREGYEIGYVDVVDRPRLHGVSNYGFWDRLWIGILDLFGVWWLIRRRKRVPEVSES